LHFYIMIDNASAFNIGSGSMLVQVLGDLRRTE
jgi:hypothetical protein